MRKRPCFCLDNTDSIESQDRFDSLGAGRSRVLKGFSCLEVFLHLSEEQLPSSTSLSPDGSVISVGKALP